MTKFLIFLVCAIVSFFVTFLVTRNIFAPRPSIEDQESTFSEERPAPSEAAEPGRGAEGGTPADDQ